MKITTIIMASLICLNTVLAADVCIIKRDRKMEAVFIACNGKTKRYDTSRTDKHLRPEAIESKLLADKLSNKYKIISKLADQGDTEVTLVKN
ncbi:hypothetical protein N9O57_02230 [bacterium]|nr:hypothetical protein [bacterium]